MLYRRSLAALRGRTGLLFGVLVALVAASFGASAEPALDLEAITDVLDEAPGHIITVAGAIFAAIGLMFIISKIRQVVKA